MTRKKSVVADLAAAFASAAGPVFSLKRAAGLVERTTRTLRKAIAAGDLVVSRPGGGRIMVTPRRLAEWVAAGER